MRDLLVLTREILILPLLQVIFVVVFLVLLIDVVGVLFGNLKDDIVLLFAVLVVRIDQHELVVICDVVVLVLLCLLVVAILV